MNFFFYLLRLRCYKAKCVKTHCLQEGVGQIEPRFQGEGVILAVALPSVVCTSACNARAPSQAVEIFGNISTALGTLAIC